MIVTAVLLNVLKNVGSIQSKLDFLKLFFSTCTPSLNHVTAVSLNIHTNVGPIQSKMDEYNKVGYNEVLEKAE